MKDYKPIEFRQLCMVVKTVLQRDPTMDDAEWKAKSRDTLAKMGFGEPSTSMLAHAMTQVEQALRKTLGPRPLREIPAPEHTQPSTSGPVSSVRTNRPEGWDIVLRLMAKLSGASAPSSQRPAGPREVLEITEEAALDEFWRAACRDGAERISLLRAFAEVAIVRPSGWDTGRIRAAAGDHRLHATECFGCRGPRGTASWHHVIQIQHGGSNYLRNRVSLCAGCHANVHPWLKGQPVKLRGWTSLGDCSDQFQLDAEKRKQSA